MRILDRYLFIQLLYPFFMGILGFVVLLSVDPLQRAMTNVINDNIPILLVLRWFVYRIPQDLVLAFPMSCLLSCLLVFSRLSRESELTAMKSGGISFFRLLWPISLFALFSTTLTFAFNEFVIPISAVKRREIRQGEMLGQRFWQDKNNVVLRTGPNELIYVKRVSPTEKKIENLVRFRFEGNLTRERLTCRYGFYRPEEKNWVLRQVRFGYYNEFGRLIKEEEKGEEISTLSAELNDFSRDYDNPQEQSMRELWRWITYFERNPSLNILPLKVEFYAKSALPFSCFIFCLIGAAMGTGRVRTGGFVGFGISIIIVFCYYVLLTIALSLGKNSFMPPHIAAWFPNFIFFWIGAYLVDDANTQK